LRAEAGQRKLEGGSFDSHGTGKEFRLAKRNYGFEKRQKEIARKQKQEDKRQLKLERAQDKTTDDAPATEGEVGSDPQDPQ
jgi:hypothetical protein